MVNLTSPSVIKEILDRSGFRFSKSLGQNFLIDDGVLNKMIEKSHINSDTNVLEIGPGFGTLTQRLCQSAKKVVSVEIDDTVIPILTENTEEFKNLKIVNADVMKIDLKELIQNEFGDEPVKVVANLPYYITTPIIMGLLEKELPISDIVIMIQKEVAERIAAKPGGKDYGALTVAVNFYSDPELIVEVPPSSFIPQPKVSSSVISLRMLAFPRVDVPDKKKFFSLVKASFGQRRKTLVNAVFNSGISGKSKEEIVLALNNIGLSEKCRGETLSIEDFARLSKEIFD